MRWNEISEITYINDMKMDEYGGFYEDPKNVSDIKQIYGLFVGINHNRPKHKLSIWKIDPIILTEDSTINKVNPLEYLIGIADLVKFNNNFSTVDGPFIKPTMRGKGLGVLFYTYTLDYLHRNIQSHSAQTPGSKLCWLLLAKNSKYKVVVVSRRYKEIPINITNNNIMVGDESVYNNNKYLYLRCYRK